MAPKGIAADEVPGAVDGVNNPAATGLGLTSRAFFAEEAIAGKMLANQADDGTLAFAVGNRHGGLV